MAAMGGPYIVDAYSPITGAEDLRLPRGSENGNKRSMEENARMSDTRARLAPCEIYRLFHQGGGVSVSLSRFTVLTSIVDNFEIKWKQNKRIKIKLSVLTNRSQKTSHLLLQTWS